MKKAEPAKVRTQRFLAKMSQLRCAQMPKNSVR
jgi:hypothetical protein